MFPSAKTILSETAHRPWELPPGAWVLAQTWQQLLFAHWRVDPKVVAPLIPAGLEVDTFDGSAWIGVVPFLMNNVHPRATISVQGLSRFPELNVRTYVKREDRPGVWFLSLDAGNPVAVKIGRGLFHLPYYNAVMSISTESDWVRYSSRRKGEAVDFEARYRPTGDVYRSQRGSIDEWLTERYCLYAGDERGQLMRLDIQHRPWPLQPAEVEISVNTMVPALKLPDDPPLLHYADRIDVLAWYVKHLDAVPQHA